MFPYGGTRILVHLLCDFCEDALSKIRYRRISKADTIGAKISVCLMELSVWSKRHVVFPIADTLDVKKFCLFYKDVHFIEVLFVKFYFILHKTISIEIQLFPYCFLFYPLALLVSDKILWMKNFFLKMIFLFFSVKKTQVFGDVYEFIHRGVPRRRKRASFIKTLRLGKDNRVSCFLSFNFLLWSITKVNSLEHAPYFF